MRGPVAGAWVPWGITRDGSELQYTVSTDTIEAAEFFDPLQIVTTGRAAQISFEIMILSATGMARALNGGTVTTAGATTTLASTVTPPAAGCRGAVHGRVGKSRTTLSGSCSSRRSRLGT